MPRFGGWTERQIRGRERVFDRLVAKATRAVGRTLALDLRGALTAAVTISPEPEPTPNGWQPAGGQVAAAWVYHVDHELLPYLEDAFLDSAHDVHGAAEVALGASIPKVTDALAGDYLAAARNRLVGVGDLVWNAVRVQLSEGYAAGESIQQLASRVRDVVDVTEPRARTIARTELVSAINASSLLQVKLAGFSDAECSKCWQATDDERTRIAHHQADGQCVALWQPFLVGGEGLQFPGDPTGRADNVINCRCTLGYEFHDEPLAAATIEARFIEELHPRDVVGRFAEKFDWLDQSAVDDMREEMLADEPWTALQRDALSGYSGDDYEEMNGYLRNNQYEFIDDDQRDAVLRQIDHMKAAMRPLPQGLKVQRSVGRNAWGSEADKLTQHVGHVFEEPGFLSTSTSEYYLPTENPLWSYWHLIFEVPAGTPAAYLGGEDGISQVINESELVLAPRTRFILTKVEPNGHGGGMIHARVLAHADALTAAWKESLHPRDPNTGEFIDKGTSIAKISATDFIHKSPSEFNKWFVGEFQKGKTWDFQKWNAQSKSVQNGLRNKAKTAADLGGYTDAFDGIQELEIMQKMSAQVQVGHEVPDTTIQTVNPKLPASGWDPGDIWFEIKKIGPDKYEALSDADKAQLGQAAMWAHDHGLDAPLFYLDDLKAAVLKKTATPSKTSAPIGVGQVPSGGKPIKLNTAFVYKSSFTHNQVVAEKLTHDPPLRLTWIQSGKSPGLFYLQSRDASGTWGPASFGLIQKLGIKHNTLSKKELYDTFKNDVGWTLPSPATPSPSTPPVGSPAAKVADAIERIKNMNGPEFVDFINDNYDELLAMWNDASPEEKKAVFDKAKDIQINPMKKGFAPGDYSYLTPFSKLMDIQDQAKLNAPSSPAQPNTSVPLGTPQFPVPGNLNTYTDDQANTFYDSIKQSDWDSFDTNTKNYLQKIADSFEGSNDNDEPAASLIALKAGEGPGSIQAQVTNAVPFTGKSDDWPDPGELWFTGEYKGTHGAQVYADKINGKVYLFKPTPAKLDFTVEADLAVSKLQQKVGLPGPEIHAETVDGNYGSLQQMLPNSSQAFPTKFQPAGLGPNKVQQLFKNQVFDWLIGQHDSHSENFLNDGSGNLVAIDKTQAFKFFPYDSLDSDYQPNEHPTIYKQYWKAFENGDPGIDASLNPTQGESGQFIAQLMAIPDDEYMQLLRPYAEAAAKRGALMNPNVPQSGPSPNKPVLGVQVNDVQDFLHRALLRKNNLVADFGIFYEKQLEKRNKKLGIKTPPAPQAPQPSQPQSTTPGGKIHFVGGKPFKWSTTSIYKVTYSDGDVVAERHTPDGFSERVVWTQSKAKALGAFVHQTRDPNIGTWHATTTLNKKQAWDKFKADNSDWVVPGTAKPHDLSAPMSFVSTPTKVSKFDAATIQAQHGEINDITSSTMDAVYLHFKKNTAMGSITLKTQSPTLFKALALTVAYWNDQHPNERVNMLQAVKLIDKRSAASAKLPNDNPYEKKIIDWLGTAAGKKNAPDFINWAQNTISNAAQAQAAALSGVPDPADIGLPSTDPSINFIAITSAEATAAHKKAISKHGSWTPQQLSVIKDYTGGGYSAINTALRQGKAGFGSTQTAIKNAAIMQSGMYPAVVNFMSYRSTDHLGSMLDGLDLAGLRNMIGKTFQDKGFSSTSVGKKVFGHKKYSLEIQVPQGTPGAYVRSVSHYKNENEYVLAAGTKFQIVDVQHNSYGFGYMIRVRVVP